MAPQNLQSHLRQHFGFTTFRTGQEPAIRHLLAGENVLVVMPTGAGKSLIYQLPACMTQGVTLVISPLIALMKDQVDALNRRAISATAINSTVPAAEQQNRLQAMRKGVYRLVYLAPERLRHRSFVEAVAETRVNMVAVDEAHCISEWGHDFRPDYLHIAPARRTMGLPACVALTATATPRIQDDIVRHLELSKAARIVTGFNRPNLLFEVRSTPDVPEKLRALQAFLQQNSGPGIIYVGTRRDAEEVAEFVAEVVKRHAAAYHAGLENARRTEIQEAFMTGRLHLVVATNAFGMGVDRADVRFVVHFSIPRNLEAYYQEAGRAGRDGQPARCTLLYSPQDRALQEWFIDHDAPTSTELGTLFQAVVGAAQSGVAVMADEELAQATGLHEVAVRVGLSLLERMQALHRLGDEGRRVWLEVREWRPDRLRVLAAEIAAHRARKKRDLARMVAYAEGDACRRRRILDHFGDRAPPEAPLCCDNCLAASREPVKAALPGGAAQRVRFESLPMESRIALGILDAVRRLAMPIGRGTLAKILKGSQAKDIVGRGYSRSPYYGRLSEYTRSEVEGLIQQLIRLGALKAIGADLPVLRLTPYGRRVLDQRQPIRLHLPRPHDPNAASRKREARDAGGTVAYTAELLERGMSPAEIAVYRSLKPSTIYGHLAQMIAAGFIDVAAVVPPDTVRLVRGAIRRVGGTESLRRIQEDLPAEVPYELIRCVAAAWDRERAASTPEGTLPERRTAESSRSSPEERSGRVDEPGEGGEDAVAAFLTRAHPRSLPGPWECGWALDFHSRFAGSEWSRTETGELAYRFKYRGESALVRVLVERLLGLVRQHPELADVDAIVPVPASVPRASSPVRDLAIVLASRLRLPVRAGWLVRIRATRPQKEMRTWAQKRANVAGAFAVRGPVGGRRLLVVDDLYDSGATLQEIARIFRRAGAASVKVLTLTRTIHSDA